jgi:quinolinate synthase
MLESDVASSKQAHTGAEILAHPECRREVLEKADHIFSTTGMTGHCSSSDSKEFIIATENGLLHRLRKENPDKHFYPCSEYAICPDMKTIDLESVLDCLEKEEYEVRVGEKVREQAKKALDRMLEAGRA